MGEDSPNLVTLLVTRDSDWQGLQVFVRKLVRLAQIVTNVVLSPKNTLASR
jgi:hypothetical protein